MHITLVPHKRAIIKLVRQRYKDETTESLIAISEAMQENLPDAMMEVVNSQIKLQTINKMIVERDKV